MLVVPLRSTLPALTLRPVASEYSATNVLACVFPLKFVMKSVITAQLRVPLAPSRVLPSRAGRGAGLLLNRFTCPYLKFIANPPYPFDIPIVRLRLYFLPP